MLPRIVVFFVMKFETAAQGTPRAGYEGVDDPPPRGGFNNPETDNGEVLLVTASTEEVRFYLHSKPGK